MFSCESFFSKKYQITQVLKLEAFRKVWQNIPEKNGKSDKFWCFVLILPQNRPPDLRPPRNPSSSSAMDICANRETLADSVGDAPLDPAFLAISSKAILLLGTSFRIDIWPSGWSRFITRRVLGGIFGCVKIVVIRIWHETGECPGKKSAHLNLLK